jgi:hypothetical protein
MVTVTTPKDHTHVFADLVIVYLLIKCFVLMRMSVRCPNTTATSTLIVETLKEVMNVNVSMVSTETVLCAMTITNVTLESTHAMPMQLARTDWEVIHVIVTLVSMETDTHAQTLTIA